MQKLCSHAARNFGRLEHLATLFFLVLLLLIASSHEALHENPNEAEHGQAEHDDWHPKRQFSSKPLGMSLWYSEKINAGLRLIAEGRIPEALQLCDKLLRAEPNHAPTLTLKAKVLAAQGFASAARKSVQDAIDADPGWKEAYDFLVSLYLSQGHRDLLSRDNEAAYECFRRILLLDLEGQFLSSIVKASAYDGMARALYAAGAEAAAMENLELALALNPRSAELHHRLARILIEQAERVGGDGALISFEHENKTMAVLQRALELQYHPLLWTHLLAAQQRIFDWSLSSNMSFTSLPSPFLSLSRTCCLLFACRFPRPHTHARTHAQTHTHTHTQEHAPPREAATLNTSIGRARAWPLPSPPAPPPHPLHARTSTPCMCTRHGLGGLSQPTATCCSSCSNASAASCGGGGGGGGGGRQYEHGGVTREREAKAACGVHDWCGVRGF